MVEILDDNNNVRKITDEDINASIENKIIEVKKESGLLENDDIFHYINNETKMTTDRMQSEMFSFTIGVTPGYNHHNENGDIDIIPILKKVQDKVEKEADIFVSCVVKPSVVVYKEEWGCPDQGEKIFEISSVRNPIFEKDKWKWRKACELIAQYMAIELEQSTVTAQFRSTYVYYIKNNNLY